MDLSQFDLRGLQSIHLSLLNLLKDLDKQFEQLPKDDDLYVLMSELLAQKAESYNIQIGIVESKIDELNKEKLMFSVEYMLWNFGTFRSSVQVHFITTSKAYREYGPYVTGRVLFNKEELPNLLERIRHKQNSDGVIRFEETVSDRMSNEVKEKLKTEGFYTSEIDHIN